jgi:hypothetical protein
MEVALGRRVNWYRRLARLAGHTNDIGRNDG